MKRILTGIQPSGKLHLGNYSVMKKMIAYQEKSDLFCFIADLHSLTTFSSKENLIQNTNDAICDFLALGMNPEKSTFWLQSTVPLVTELTWYLSMMITVNQLSLAHSYKDKVAKGISPSGGLFIYPILMASDILAFNSNIVPVGKDQKQHVEITRDMAMRFNQQYGEVFVIPEPEIDEETAILPGIDGQKMSKSYGNTINIFDEEKNIKKAVMSIVTDSKGINEPKDPDTNIIYAIHSFFLNEEERKILKDKFITPGTGYGDLKKSLLNTILDYFSPYRKKREELVANKNYINDVVELGRKKATLVAEPVLDKVRSSFGIKRY